MRDRGARGQGGFSLLEAVVAITILAAVSLAIYGAINTWLQNYGRLEAAERRAEAMQSLVGFVETLNPLLQPEGETSFGELTIRWRSEPVEPVRIAGSGEFSTRYDVGLYDVTALALVAAEPLAEVTVRSVGYGRLEGIDRLQRRTGR